MDETAALARNRKNNHHRNQQTDRREINPADLPRVDGSLSPKAGLTG